MRNPVSSITPAIQLRLKEIFKLWDRLSDFGMNEGDEGVRFCMRRICELIGADYAFWVGGVRVVKSAPGQPTDILNGWRIGAIEPLDPAHHDLEHNRKIVKAAHDKKAERGLDPGATTITLAAQAGRFRAYTLRSGELVDVEAFEQTPHYDLAYRRFGTYDRIWVTFPVNSDAESTFCFDKIGEGRCFDDEQLQLAAFALRGIRWFHRQLLLSHGLGVCVQPLTVGERRVSKELLAGGSERDIGLKLHLSPGTVHQYATRVYSKFGVRGRTEFTALWLAGGF